MTKRWKIALSTVGLLLIAAVVVCALFYTGVWQFNHPAQAVRGVDVSHYQGEIDWPVLASQDIQFAFIKATEGSAYQDAYFQANWQEAQNANLRVGAYHFFSYDSPGAGQAKNFIEHVPLEGTALPPVIDVEFYGGNEKNPPDRASVEPELRAMADALKAHYGVSPILYATEKSYALYIAGAFEDCDIWIRNVLTTPTLSDGRSWTFWQYSNRMRLDGYAGEEPYIDMNVFYGTQDEFDGYSHKAAQE